MIGKITINGIIGDCGKEGKGVMLLDIISQVKSQPNATSFECRINSIGGNVEEGFKIYDYLNLLPIPVKTIGEETVASIATVVLMAGHDGEIYLDQNTNPKLMIHLPSGGVSGNAKDIISYGEMMEDVEDLMIGFYKEKLNLDVSSIYALLADETWLTCSQFIELGFAKPLINATTEPPIVALANKSNTNLNFL